MAVKTSLQCNALFCCAGCTTLSKHGSHGQGDAANHKSHQDRWVCATHHNVSQQCITAMYHSITAVAAPRTDDWQRHCLSLSGTFVSSAHSHVLHCMLTSSSQVDVVGASQCRLYGSFLLCTCSSTSSISPKLKSCIQHTMCKCCF